MELGNWTKNQCLSIMYLVLDYTFYIFLNSKAPQDQHTGGVPSPFGSLNFRPRWRAVWVTVQASSSLACG